MATVQGARAFTMNTRDVNHVGGDMHTHYHTHSHTELPPQLDLNILSEADIYTAPTGISYQPPIIPKSTDPSLPSSLRYSLLMFQEKQGYPFWCPEPNSQLPYEYRKEGLMIGDVGIVHHDRPFDFLFNITCSADHPINHRGVPAGFTQVPQDLEINKVANYRGGHSYIVHPKYAISRYIAYGPEDPRSDRFHQFISINHEGALLVLPEASSTATLENKAVFRDYAKKHANEWFTYARKHRGRMFPTGTNPSLYMITGWEKCSSWGISSVFIPPSISPKAIRLSFYAAEDDGKVFTTRWCHRSQWDESRHGNDWGENQSVFARGFKISKRRKKTKVKVRDITATTVNVEKILDLPPGTSASNSSYHSNSASGTSSNHGNGYNTGGYTCPMALANPEDAISISDSATQEQLTFHPCDLINNFLHEAASNAGDIAISHDDDWISILDEGTAALKDMKSFFRTLCSNFDFFVDGDTIYIEKSLVPKEQPESLLNIFLQKARPSGPLGQYARPRTSKLHTYETDTYMGSSAVSAITSHGGGDHQQEQRRDSSVKPRASEMHTYKTDPYVGTSAMSAITSHGGGDRQQEQRHDSSVKPRASKLGTHATDPYVKKSAGSAIASHGNEDRQQEQRRDSSVKPRASKLGTHATNPYVSAWSAIASHGNEDRQQEQRRDSLVKPRASKLGTHATDPYLSTWSAIASHGNEDRQPEQRDNSSVRPKAPKLRTHETDTDAGSSTMSASTTAYGLIEDDWDGQDIVVSETREELRRVSGEYDSRHQF
ncbi:hypothetical protein Moror_4342 [Moniliophthora roreri MCA 2997]|uniref:Uncharacterized protein n=2 Tax=Moniliophthora roreri TaxID=221103 RepID=V2YLS9_MONRO|nr:hypothetical protein Moror_4342 [Moniliophthora roreri MCA 2997]